MNQVPADILEKFTQRDEDGALYTLSLEIALTADKPLAELAEGAIACYRLFIEKFGGSLTWYLADSMRRARRFSEKYVDIFPTLCKEEADIALPRYRVFNGSGIQDYLPPVFSTGEFDEFSWLQIHLPPTLSNDWDELLTLLNRAGERIPVSIRTRRTLSVLERPVS